MNYSTAIFLVNKDVRAIKTSYEVDKDGKGIAPFTMYKTLDPSVCKGDYVVVPTGTRHQMTVVRVESVDDEVDFQSGTHVDWAVTAIAVAPYEEILSREAEAVTAIKSAEKKRMQDELRDKLIADNPDLARLGALDVTPALPSPPAPKA